MRTYFTNQPFAEALRGLKLKVSPTPTESSTVRIETEAAKCADSLGAPIGTSCAMYQGITNHEGVSGETLKRTMAHRK